MKIFFLRETIHSLPREPQTGNIEYKRKITHTNKNTLDKRATQMLYRTMEGNGKANYYIGVDDNGNTQGISICDLIISLENLEKISSLVKLSIENIKIYKGLSQNKYVGIVEIIANTINNLYSFI